VPERIPFLLRTRLLDAADYRAYRRLGTFKPVAMLGGVQASREPWRNLYAHLVAGIGWADFARHFRGLELYRDLAARPRAILDAMLASGINAPLASSCGRLFDAAAAAVGLCRERQGYEGEAAARLEASIEARALQDPSSVYRFIIQMLPDSGLPYLEPRPVWIALLDDLLRGVAPGVIAARFHLGLAQAVVGMAVQLATDTGSAPRFDTVALTGGCFHNRVLAEEVARLLRERQFQVLMHARVPAGDGGLALGQAAVAAARIMGDSACASAFPAVS
jgi:hydrogenase maturation protein HypF